MAKSHPSHRMQKPRRRVRRWPYFAAVLILFPGLGAAGWYALPATRVASEKPPLARPTDTAAQAASSAKGGDAVVPPRPATGGAQPTEQTPSEEGKAAVRTARVVPMANTPAAAEEVGPAPDSESRKTDPVPQSTAKPDPRPAVLAGGGENHPVAFVARHCVKCHGPDKQAGDVRLDDLPADATTAVERWAAVRDQVRDGLMPPLKESRPDPTQARALVAWVTAAVAARPARLPNEGSLIPHGLLFGRPATGAGASPERIWRVAAQTYSAWLGGLFRERMAGIVQPFTLVGERGIRDFADLYTIDEPTTEVLLRNAAIVVKLQTSAGRGAIPEFQPLMNPATPPTRGQLQAAFTRQFQMATNRAPAADELARYLTLYDQCVPLGDRQTAAVAVLQAILMKPDALFRYETVAGRSGRQLLSPPKLEQAVSLTLGHRRNPQFGEVLAKAAPRGDAAVKEAVAAHVRARLDDPKDADARQRILGFFHEYFEYTKALNVFKDPPKDVHYAPGALIGDTDALIRHILAEDKDVFRQLLTTETSFVNYALRENKQTKKIEPTRATMPHPNNNKGQAPIETAYFGLAEWPAQQPVNVAQQRIGVLMQPSWLIAWSTNFDNDAVTRGRWIRERLLGGTVPNIPIGVAAMVPDEPHRTFRDRLAVTRDGRCWKCHQKMDELGLPFEQFDHLGRFRTAEKVVDAAATLKNIDAKGKSRGPVYRDAALVTTGAIADSGDVKLDGAVKDPREMMRRIADSDLARQVFIRHVFRYFLGRNESLADARTLQDADRAYQAGGGSFKALVVSLLTSEAFLYSTKSTESTVGSGGSR